MSMLTVIGETVVIRHIGWTQFKLPGASVELDVPDSMHNVDQVRTANELGLTVEAMNKGHDLLHVMLANWIGLECSPTLAAVCQGPLIDADLNAAEEAAVLAVQKYIALLGINPANLVRWTPVATGGLEPGPLSGGSSPEIAHGSRS